MTYFVLDLEKRGVLRAQRIDLRLSSVWAYRIARPLPDPGQKLRTVLGYSGNF
jgi:hypothetical protein